MTSSILKIRKDLLLGISLTATVAAFTCTGNASAFSSGGAPADGIFLDPTSGNDANDGSTTSVPVKTLARAQAVHTTGKTIYVRGGTHLPTAAQTFSKDGTITDPILITAYPGEFPIWDGGLTLGGGLDGTSATMPTNTDIITITGDWVIFKFQTVTRSTKNGLVLYRVANSEVQDCILSYCWKGGAWAGDNATLANVWYRRVTVTRNGQSNNPSIQPLHTAIWPQVIVIETGVDCGMEDIDTYQNYGEGFGVMKGAVDATLRRIRSVDNFSMNGYIDASTGIVIDGLFSLYTGDNEFRGGVNNADRAPSNLGFSRETGTGHFSLTVLNAILVGGRYCLNHFIEIANASPIDSLFAGITMVNPEVAAFRTEAGAASGNVVTNCIFSTDSGKPLLSGDQTGYTFSYNNFHGGIGTGTQQFTYDPLFVNRAGATAEDFRMQAGSQVAGAGLLNAGLTTDYWGTTRAAPDSIGAYYDPAGVLPDPPPGLTYIRDSEIWVASQTAEVSNTDSTSFASCLQLTVPMTSGDVFYLFYGLDAHTLSGAFDVVWRVYDGTTELEKLNAEPRATSPAEYLTFTNFLKYTAAATGDITFALQFRPESNGVDTKVRNATLLAFKHRTGDVFVETAASIIVPITPETTLQTVATTIGSESDLLVCASLISQQTPNNTNMMTGRIYEGATKVAEGFAQTSDNQSLFPLLAAHIKENAAPGTHTYDFKGVETHATAGTAIKRRMLILDITGTDMFQSGNTPADGTAITGSTLTDSKSMTVTIPATKQYVSLMISGMKGGSTGIASLMNAVVDGVEVAQQVRRPANANLTYLNGFAALSVDQVASGSRTFKQQCANASGAGATQAMSSKLIAFRIEA